jgi:hypothetical protein
MSNDHTTSQQRSHELDLFPEHPQTHCKHGTWLKEDICLTCQQEHDQAIRDDERNKIAEWLRGQAWMIAAINMDTRYQRDKWTVDDETHWYVEGIWKAGEAVAHGTYQGVRFYA